MFIRDNFQFNRGLPNCQAQGEGLTSIMHSYKSDTDTLSTILMSGYFPDYMNESVGLVLPEDTILIKGTDGVALVLILTINPFTVGTNLLIPSIGALLVIGAPIVAVDGNGMKLTGNVLTLEYANAVDPGIISTTTQIFSGAKTFTNPLTVGSGFSAAGGGPNDIQVLTTTSPGGVNIQTNSLGNVLQYSFGSPVIPSSSYAGMEWKGTGFGPEPPDRELALYNAGGIGMKLNSSQEAIFPIGLHLISGSAALLKLYDETTFNTTFHDGVTTTTNFAFKINLLNNLVFLTLTAPATVNTSLAPGDFFTSNSQLPLALRPPTTRESCFFLFDTTTSTGSLGLIEIDTNGFIIIWWTPNKLTSYPVNNVISFNSITTTYSVI